jgi:phage gp36-like protein
VTILYATIADLREVLSGTDSGIGTPAQLSDLQLTQALTSASSRISVYAGSVYDSSSPQAVPPDIFHDLCLDLAAFWAWKNYLKGKVIPSTHPAFIAYQNAQKMLDAVRAGEIRLDPAVVGAGTGAEMAHVINRIPPIFKGDDSNTRVGQDGFLESDTPVNMWSPRGMDWSGQGWIP